MSFFIPVAAVQTLLDESGGAVFFTVAQICDALNETLLSLTASGKWAPASSSLTLSIGADLVALPKSAVFIPQYILLDSKKYFFTTMAQLERYDRYWTTTTRGYPTDFVLWDINTIRCFPKPDIQYTATLWGIPYPSTEITSNLTQIDLPPLLQEALVYAATGEMLEHTHPALADEYVLKSESYMNLFRRQFRNRQSHNTLRLRPSTQFQVGQLGSIQAGKISNQPSNFLPW